MPAAELVGFDPRRLRLDVDQPAPVVGGDADFQRQGAAGGMGPAGELRKDGLEKSAQVGDMIHRDRAIDDFLVEQPARPAQNRLDRRDDRPARAR